MNPGITSQYGFLYQRMLFVYKALENISTNCLFVFEGKDDIDVLPNEQIASITKGQTTHIQVKSGVVDQNCFSKVICNWLLLNTEDELIYELILENEFSFQYDVNDQVDAIYNYIVAGQDKKKNSVSRKTYELFKSHIVAKDTDFVKQKIENLLNSYTKTVLTVVELEAKMQEVFKRDYCQDIVLYDIASIKRLNRFLQLINEEIDLSIKSRAPYSLLYNKLFSLAAQVREEISDTKYTVDIAKIRKDLKTEAEKIVSEKVSREVSQLILVNSNTEFVVDNIVNELFYKDFRQVYETHKSVDISNIEDCAHENFKDSLFSLSPEEKCIPRNVFNDTVKRPIASDLMPDSPIYRKGCYVYLTGDCIEEEKQITWGEDNEN